VRIVMSTGASFVARRTLLFVLSMQFLAFLAGQGSAQEATFDRESYYRAVEYCRNNSFPGRVIALSLDRKILCFDGQISRDTDASLVEDLKQDGLFVVRSRGGNSGPAIAISDILRDRHATVVVYDYCNSACAVFFLIASYQTYVLKGALVTWHYAQSGDPGNPFCTFVTTPQDGGTKRLEQGPCQSGGERGLYGIWPELTRFFNERMVNPLSGVPPDSFYVRRIVRNLYAELGVYHDVLWTLHPRYYPRLFKAKIVYEAYPESQEEVDAMRDRLHWKVRVIYDP
jgi:hypothetical protein